MQLKIGQARQGIINSSGHARSRALLRYDHHQSCGVLIPIAAQLSISCQILLVASVLPINW
ncbi:hypothetical protein M378DRAFT_160394 [Amanita muscaria Koide BX008]|uniref:Uncharacterized protein n=1 Tax=Amanita muscaria (strain Koide BX008) TaxID=946122 RepID=A0A0C2XBX0_AMAMK|nr:hypothetical protein M378DRAFT_160394 [Amanita muscaria Koide BX008]